MKAGWSTPPSSALLIGTLLALVAGTFTIVVVPVETVTASGQVEAVNCRSPYCGAIPGPSYLSFPTGKIVQVTWAATWSPAGQFAVASLDAHQWVCKSAQPDGSCAITSDGGQYWFDLATPPNPELGSFKANFTASYSVPLP